MGCKDTFWYIGVRRTRYVIFKNIISHQQKFMVQNKVLVQYKKVLRSVYHIQ